MQGCDTCPLFWTEKFDDGEELLYCADEVIDRMRLYCPDWQEGEWVEIVRGKNWKTCRPKGSDGE